MRKYTAIDMLRIVKLSKEIELKGLNLIKEYNNRHPEKSAKEQMENVFKTLGINLKKIEL